MGASLSLEELIELNLKSGRADVSQKESLEKEILHYDILAALEAGGFLSKLTFQGGTCLRLMHGANRYSEDLDFAGGQRFDRDSVTDMHEIINQRLSARYKTSHVTVSPPKKLPDQNNLGVSVPTWRISVDVNPAKRDQKKSMIKLEVATIDAQSREALPVHLNHEGLPESYQELLIPSQSLEEIMADKLVAFPNCNYLRYRDLWDLTWLARKGIKPNMGYVTLKLDSYESSNYMAQLDERISQMSQIVHSKEFMDTMSRFVPPQIRKGSVDKPEFLQYMARTVEGLFREVQDALNDSDQSKPDEFLM